MGPRWGGHLRLDVSGPRVRLDLSVCLQSSPLASCPPSCLPSASWQSSALHVTIVVYQSIHPTLLGAPRRLALLPQLCTSVSVPLVMKVRTYLAGGTGPKMFAAQ